MPRMPRGIFKRPGRSRYYGSYIDGAGNRKQLALSERLDESSMILDKLRHDAMLERKGLGAVVAQSLSIAALTRQYLEELPQRGSPTYCRNRERDLDVILPLLRVRLVADIRATELERVRKILLGRDLARRTVNDRIGTLIGVLVWAEKTGRISRNPVRGFEKLRIKTKDLKRRRRRMSAPEVWRLVEAARAEDARLKGPNRVPQAPMLEAVVWTGFRWSSAAMLTWGDLENSSHNDATVWWLRARSDHEKTDTEVVNPIPTSLATALNRLRASQGHAIGRLPSNNDPMFLTALGKPWVPKKNQRNSLRWLDRVRAAAGLPERFDDGTRIDWHALRHTLATLLMEATSSTSMAQAWLGHASEKTTLIYSDLAKMNKVSALEQLERLMLPKAEERRDSC